jgi:hypothetical protein
MQKKRIHVILGALPLTIALLSASAYAQTPDNGAPNMMPPHPTPHQLGPMEKLPPPPPGSPEDVARRQRMEDHKKAMFDKIDANHDGKIDRAEFLAEASHQFDLLDSDHKGYLVPEDFDRMARKMRERHMKEMKDPSRGQDMPNGVVHK